MTGNNSIRVADGEGQDQQSKSKFPSIAEENSSTVVVTDTVVTDGFKTGPLPLATPSPTGDGSGSGEFLGLRPSPEGEGEGSKKLFFPSTTKKCLKKCGQTKLRQWEKLKGR